MSILINRISNKSILDGGKSVYQVTVKTDHARHPRLPLPLPLPPSIFHPLDNVGPETYEVRFPWQRKPSSVASRQEGGGAEGRGEGGRIICIEQPLPAGRSRINIRWLISFRADQGVAFLKFSWQIVPSRGNRPFSPLPCQRFADDPPCRLVALFPPAKR